MTRLAMGVRAVAAGVALMGMTGSVWAQDLSSEDQKTMYALGVAISQNLAGFNLTESEIEAVKAGLADGALKRTLKVDMNTYGPRIQQVGQARANAQAEVEKKKGAAFLEKAAAEAGVKKTASGAIVKITAEGKGANPKASDTVKVHYKGTLTDGTEFDSSYKRGQPATFPLGNVVKCWTEALQLMKPGGKARLVCPAAIAYGDRGSPPLIKPGATLVFEVELLGIEK